MSLALWFVAVGALLTFMALAGSVLRRLPLSAAQVYLLVGVGLGPLGLGLLRVDPLEQAALLEPLSEVAVILSLFAAGLKLRTPLSDDRWKLPVRLATLSMVATVGLIAAAGMLLLDLPVGAAVLLGAILAPTDPVLASDVQIDEPDDRDRLRFALTGEAGLNDGTAFPFVMLGLGLLGLHELGESGARWVGVDVLWAGAAGVGVGALLGLAVGRLVVFLRREHREAVGLDDFLALGLVALSYGVALLAHAYAFLAVFAAGLALRYEERRHTGDRPAEEVEALAREGKKDEVAVGAETAPAYMASAVLGFAEQLERMGGVALVVLVGALLHHVALTLSAVLFVGLLLFVIRPLAVAFGLGLFRSKTTRVQRVLMAWFGIRGIGSVYYLMYAENHGLADPFAERLLSLVLLAIAVSVVLHGVSVTPVMNWYRRRAEGEERAADAV